MAIGLDVGTYNLVCCTRDEKGEFDCSREVNAFLEISLTDRIVINMMRAVNVPVLERKSKGYALGEDAVRIAYTMSELELKRPMKDGCVNAKEKEAFELLKTMIHSLIEDDVKANNEVLYYTVPANALNEETDADYHGKVIESILLAFESEKGYKVRPFPINEGLALVYAELKAANYTGIGVSCGAGMVNLCFAMFGVPVFQFALVNSGDWIDKMAAKATGETPTFINQEKTKIDLSIEPTSLVERAIQTQYRIMIEKTVNGIVKGLSEAGKKARSDKPIDVVVAGGTSMPKGFDTMFGTILKQHCTDITIGKVIRPDDPLYSVARGALIAAENSMQ